MKSSSYFYLENIMIEVIEWGHLPEEKFYKAHCDQCQTQFRFQLKDGKRVDVDYNHTVIEVICPLCTNPVHVPE